ncbi:GNAT family N-acetyltransferase, partial [Streptomyces sp. MBT54]|uniref:GNAT family N-acetyltransferase n=1 Tax=Streptomyces sp. MBT54 TaxID=1488385 RepID=UPI001F1FA3C9
AAEAFVRRQWERAATGAGYPFAIVRSRDRRPVGAIGLWLRELPEGRASLGYWLTDLARGQGVARAALRTVTGWALRDLGVPRLQLYIEPWNTASARIAEDIGFRRERLPRGCGTTSRRTTGSASSASGSPTRPARRSAAMCRDCGRATRCAAAR